ncbi:MAG: helix-turn-helix domain-containing protein [Desulfosporosinus sp.]|nr:helix-turn-helix domain-containing protein [Desulfosporosinus sp.]
MVGKRIATLRKEKGWTQKELAKVAKLSTGYIAAIEEGYAQE